MYFQESGKTRKRKRDYQHKRTQGSLVQRPGLMARNSLTLSTTGIDRTSESDEGSKVAFGK